jgi:hypothetical protein
VCGVVVSYVEVSRDGRNNVSASVQLQTSHGHILLIRDSKRIHKMMGLICSTNRSFSVGYLTALPVLIHSVGHWMVDECGAVTKVCY